MILVECDHVTSLLLGWYCPGRHLAIKMVSYNCLKHKFSIILTWNYKCCLN